MVYSFVMLGSAFYRTQTWKHLLYSYKKRIFYWTITRLPLSWIKWLGWSHFLTKSVDPVLEYIKKNRRRLNKSYEQDERQMGLILEQPYPGRTFSDNIEPEIYDKTRLNDVLVISGNSLENKWKRRILIEYTPRGNVYMYYDVFKHGFAYYADQTGIPYAILNAVAMKYVMVFCCRDFYMDEATVPVGKHSLLAAVFFEDNDEEEKKKKREKNGIPEINVKGGPFAKFKDYSKSASKTSSMSTKMTTATKVSDNIAKNKSSMFMWLYNNLKKWMTPLWGVSNPVTVPSVADAPQEPPKEKMTNKFIYVGHVHNWQPVQKPPKKNREPRIATQYDAMFGSNPRISYKAWAQAQAQAPDPKIKHSDDPI